MSDTDDLQGLWEIESLRSSSGDVGHGFTHYEFRGDRVLQLDPSQVDGGAWGTFTVDETTTPKRLDTTYTYADKNGKPFERTYFKCYELTGDMLRIGGARVFGQRPERIGEDYATVTTLSRFTGERPATKQASGKPERQSAVLGTVTWNDNLDWWKVSVGFVPEQTVSVSITPGDAGDDAALETGAAFVAWARENDVRAREYAATQMVELAEDWQDEDETTEPITAESFARRITLDEITVEADGSGSLWYDDDQMFGGHVVVVAVDAERNFTDAQMMG